MEIDSVYIDEIVVGDRLTLNRGAVDLLKKSIKKLGSIKTPISVRALPDDAGWALVTGRHRLQACIELGMPQIPAREETGTELDARLCQERPDAGTAASSKLMITEAERRFPCRIKLSVPAGGLGARLTEMQAWLDENCGDDGWAVTPAGLRGIVNDAFAIYFLDPASATAFVARWCAGSKLEIKEGAFQMREDRPKQLQAAPMHKTC
jgi:ParB-like nuclease domain